MRVAFLATAALVAFATGCGQNYWDMAPDQARPPAMQATQSDPAATARALERHVLPLPSPGNAMTGRGGSNEVAPPASGTPAPVAEPPAPSTAPAVVPAANPAAPAPAAH